MQNIDKIVLKSGVFANAAREMGLRIGSDGSGRDQLATLLQAQADVFKDAIVERAGFELGMFSRAENKLIGVYQKLATEGLTPLPVATERAVRDAEGLKKLANTFPMPLPR